MWKIYKTITVVTAIAALIVFQFSNSYTRSNGSPAGRSGAPGDQTCQNGCHNTYSLNSGSYQDSIRITTNMVNGEYAEDSVYQVTVSYSPVSLSSAGFEITALGSFTNSSSSVGTFISTSNNTQTVTGSGRDYVTHTNAGTSPSGNSISWTFDWQAPSISKGDIRFYLALNDANNNSLTSGDYIYTKKLTVNHHPAPQPSISANKTTICVGDTIDFKGSATGQPTEWDWHFPKGSPNQSDSQNQKVVFKQSGSQQVSLVARDSIASSDPVTKTITVKGKPQANINYSGSKTLCSGDSLKLTASSPNGNTFKWSTQETSDSIFVRDSGEYTVTAFNSPCPSDTSDPFSVREAKLPALSLSSNPARDTICSQDTIRFQASSGFDTYQFTNPSSKDTLASGPMDSLVIPQPQKNIQVTVEAMDTNGCKKISDTISKSVDSAVQVSGLTCANTTTNRITFQWDSSAKATHYEVSIDTGKTWTRKDSNSHTVSGLDFEETIQLQVRAVDSTSVCKDEPISVKTCQTEPCAKIAFDLEKDSIICPSDSAHFRFSNFSTSRYAIAFNGKDYQQALTFKAPLNETDTISVNIIDSNQINCPPRSFRFPVKVRTPEQASLTLEDSSNIVCMNDSVSVSGDNPTGRYDFYRNDTLLFKDTAKAFTYQPAIGRDSIFAIVTDTNNCVDTTNPLTIGVKPLPKPGFIYTISKLTVDFEDTTNGSVKARIWELGDGNQRGGETFNYTYDSSRQYQVSLAVKDSNGCWGQTTDTIRVQKSGSRVFSNSGFSFKTYPNPATDFINIQFDETLKANHLITVESLRGKVLMRVRLKANQHQFRIPLEGLNAGSYLLNLDNQKTVTFIKEQGKY